jgi:phage baseplate assembly protein W
MTEKPLGTDLRVIDKEFGSDLWLSSSGDFNTVSEEYNLGQAIILRLKTNQGELSDLGHSSYGSHIYKLIGEPNNERTRELARIYTRECLRQEPRIKETVSIKVTPSEIDINQINIEISVIPIGRTTILNIVFPYYLEVA